MSSSTPKDGGPAFPVERDRQFATDSYAGMPKPGMSLRDYFAAHAPECPGVFPANAHESSTDKVVRWRWHYADAMLKARKS